MRDDEVSITSVSLEHFKGFERYSLQLRHMNVLVGANNAGKSTILAAFRILAVALRTAHARSPEPLPGPGGVRRAGYRVPVADIAVTLKNVRTDYVDADSLAEFRLSNGVKLLLFFPEDGGAFLFVETGGKPPAGPKEFKSRVPVTIATVPVLGPVEDEEPLVADETLQRGLATHRAARHFRNYWRVHREEFAEFRAMVEQTWPGMSIEPPQLITDDGKPYLLMFCTEKRVPRELYWVGFGFQVWLQLLTHVNRGRRASLMVIDEPEIYLHPDLQRRLLGILREAGPDVLLATHSAEIISDADANEVLLVNKARRSAKRLAEGRDVQAALDTLGSVQNITLAQLARNRRLLFVEGEDFSILRRFAKKLKLVELAAGTDITVVAAGGFANWERVRGMAWGLEQTLGRQLAIGVVLDRDYRSAAELDAVKCDLAKHCSLVAIHARKEIENYVLVPEALGRALNKAVKERARRRGESGHSTVAVDSILTDVMESFHEEILAQYVARLQEHGRSTGKDPATVAVDAIRWFNERWRTPEGRASVVPGKRALKAFNERIQREHGVNLTVTFIIEEMRREEIAPDLVELLLNLEQFRTSTLDPSATEDE